MRVLVGTIFGKDWSIQLTYEGWASVERPELAEQMNAMNVAETSDGFLPGSCERMMARVAGVLNADFRMEPVADSEPGRIY